MDEWYVQNASGPKTDSMIYGTPLNPLFDQMKREKTAVTSMDDHWDLDATADDNEAYEIELEQSE